MSRLFKYGLPLLLILGLAVGGLWWFQKSDPTQGLVHPPDKMVLYSLDGREGVPEHATFQGEWFYHWPVMGQVEITDPNQQQQLMNSLRAAMQTPGLVSAKCFSPRHALRITSKGHDLDYVVCFECRFVSVYQDGKDEKRGSTTSRDPEPYFNQVLTEFSIPLAPDRNGK